MKMHFRSRGIQSYVEHMHGSSILKDTAYLFMRYPTNHMNSFKTTCCSYFCNSKKSAILKRKKSADSDQHKYSMNATKVNQERGQLDYF